MSRIFDNGSGESLRVFAPSLLEKGRAREYAGRLERAPGSPGTMKAFRDTLLGIDVRAAVPMISVPTLVVHTADDIAIPIDNGRWLAEHIPGARFVELPGQHMVYDPDRFADEGRVVPH